MTFCDWWDTIFVFNSQFNITFLILMTFWLVVWPREENQSSGNWSTRWISGRLWLSLEGGLGKKPHQVNWPISVDLREALWVLRCVFCKFLCFYFKEIARLTDTSTVQELDPPICSDSLPCLTLQSTNSKTFHQWLRTTWVHLRWMSPLHLEVNKHP